MFNVNDASGEILTMGVRATLPENKPAVFGAFFATTTEKKRRKGNKATSKWTLEFQAQPLDSKEVKKMVDKLSAEIQNMEAAIKKPRETAGKRQAAQTMLRRALKRAIPVKNKSDKKKAMESPIYKELEVKRYENRVGRKDLLEMENKLRAKVAYKT
ncbi:hypothetical protein BG011_007996 [Mortierella polycephala]|uniref:Uncharacterized protein n=1 Tax=Mortierella polycephala TaxID=41804 RepID=A0A9P6PNV3_9FUNG|nr:hypothetical protein BG011_007996 [Mortierella polycephala]